VQGRQITISDTASRVVAWDKSIVSKRLGRSSVAHAPKSGESGTLSATHPRRGAGHPRAARSMHESSEPDGTHLDVGSDRCCGHAIEAFLCLHRPETSRGSAAIRSSGLQHRRRLPKWPPGPALIAGYPHPVTNGSRPGAILNEDLTLSWFASPAAPAPSSWCSACSALALGHTARLVWTGWCRAAVLDSDALFSHSLEAQYSRAARRRLSSAVPTSGR
jgi:hypothetical protein